MAPVVFLPDAVDDTVEIHGHYQNEREGLGDQFLVALKDVVDRIKANPRLHGVVWRDIRAASLRRFPYIVYYRDRNADVLIVAVQHGRRSMRGWKDRV